MACITFCCDCLVLAACVALCCALPAQHFTKASPAESGGNSTRVGGTYGLDLSSYFSVSDFECLKKDGFDFAIIRAYRSTGENQSRVCKLYSK